MGRDTERSREYSARPRRDSWDAARILGLRRHLGVSQGALAGELGTRQQTVSEWETGRYRPRGASARMLSVIAERAGFEYDAGGGDRSETADEDPFAGGGE